MHKKGALGRLFSCSNRQRERPHHHPIPPLPLGLVQGAVGPVEQLGAVGVTFVDGDPDAHGQRDLAAGEGDRLLVYRRTQIFGDCSSSASPKITKNSSPP
ncbi:MAG: hypothetical protein AUJ55_05240 [Proteobacteria bacterium CG1_02_64_396]|nr:MAG: hypothetical protein AUJ55_05240 [Proteobacteria bacterium CG1_02_64_396]